MKMLQIEVVSDLGNGRRVVRQQVIDVPAKFVKKPVSSRYQRRAVQMIHPLDKTMPKNFDTGIIIASAKGGLSVALEFMGKKGKRKPRIDYKRQHKSDFRHVDIYH